MSFYDPYLYIICMIISIPPTLLALYAQGLVMSRYSEGQAIPSKISGASAARMILDSAGLQHVQIEMIKGELSDHYDPRAKVIRLSKDVYQNQTLASVGIAAHEAGHAIQDGSHYKLMIIRNLAVPLASLGPNIGFSIVVGGAIFKWPVLIIIGLSLFAGTIIFQLLNLPMEYNASARAKKKLVQLGIVPESDMTCVRNVLYAAALTYVAASLISIVDFLGVLIRAFASINDK